MKALIFRQNVLHLPSGWISLTVLRPGSQRQLWFEDWMCTLSSTLCRWHWPGAGGGGEDILQEPQRCWWQRLASFYSNPCVLCSLRRRVCTLCMSVCVEGSLETVETDERQQGQPVRRGCWHIGTNSNTSTFTNTSRRITQTQSLTQTQTKPQIQQIYRLRSPQPWNQGCMMGISSSWVWLGSYRILYNLHMSCAPQPKTGL